MAEVTKFYMVELDERDVPLFAPTRNPKVQITEIAPPKKIKRINLTPKSVEIDHVFD